MVFAVPQWQRSTADLVRAPLLALWVFLFMLSGCTGDGNQQAYIGWQCSGQKNSDNWRCEQREIRNGVAAGVAASGTDQQNHDAAPDNIEHTRAEPEIATRAATVVIFENGVRYKNWREQLPGLSADEAAAPTTPKARAAGERDNRVTPEPEPAYAKWADQADEKSVGNPVNDGAQDGVDQDSAEKTVPPTVSELALSSTEVTPAHRPIPAASQSRGGYTVQLGAFGNATQLTEFVEQRNLAGLDYRQGVATAASGRTLRVLLWGQFDTAAEATAAWQLETRNYPAVNDYWVRPLAAVTELSE